MKAHKPVMPTMENDMPDCIKEDKTPVPEEANKPKQPSDGRKVKKEKMEAPIAGLIYVPRYLRVFSVLHNGDHTLKRLSDKTGYSKRHISNAVTWLDKKKYIHIYKEDKITYHKAKVQLNKVTRDYHNKIDLVDILILPTRCKYCKTDTGEPQTRESCKHFNKGHPQKFKIEIDFANQEIKKIVLV